MLSWIEVNKILPNGTKFQVIDVDTGFRFNVQRRAGNDHADVQPLTRTDTKMMKRIYNNQWSWKRRAVLVRYQDRLIAASMHGMPHGAGAIQNGFPGHFCIHFLGSSTHRSSVPDLSHQLMVLKVGGEVENYLNNSTPRELIEILAVTINNSNYDLLNMIVARPITNKNMRNIQAIEAIVIETEHDGEDEFNSFTYEIPVKLKIYIKGKGLKKINTSLQFIRTSWEEPWKVVIDNLV